MAIFFFSEGSGSFGVDCFFFAAKDLYLFGSKSSAAGILHTLICTASWAMITGGGGGGGGGARCYLKLVNRSL